MRTNTLFASLLGCCMLLPLAAQADTTEYRLVIEDHRFVPEVLEVPAGERVRLVVENRDATPEEFESHSLRQEKIIAGNNQATLRIGPLEPGEYAFVGEFHEDTTRGKLVAK
jgi:plastocyanin